MSVLRETATSATRLQGGGDGDGRQPIPAVELTHTRVTIAGGSARGTLLPGQEVDKREVQLDVLRDWLNKL